MSYQHIEYRVDQGVAVLTFDRPASLNSFNAEMHAEVRDALKSARRDPAVRCLMITGNGRGFCAGQDLSDRNVAPGAERPDLG
ncbi:enoyl-CoA hydratase-related protein, partial [Marinobacterium aestuariivivens]